MVDSIQVGMVGISAESIDSGSKGYAFFPIGDPDSRVRGGFELERVQVTAISDVRANFDVIVVNERREVKELALESPLINLKTIFDNDDQNEAEATKTTGSFETNGYNKITGYVFADQNMYVYIYQSKDGSNWDLTTTITYTANGQGGFSVEIVAPYAKVNFFNRSTTTTTTTCRKLVQLSSGA